MENTTAMYNFGGEEINCNLEHLMLFNAPKTKSAATFFFFFLPSSIVMICTHTHTHTHIYIYPCDKKKKKQFSFGAAVNNSIGKVNICNLSI